MFLGFIPKTSPPLLGILGSDEQHNAVNLPTTASCGPVVTDPCREAATLV